MATKRKIQWLKYSIMLIALLCLLPTNAAAWGHSGHRIIAMIAEKYLTPKAKKAVEDLLKGESLASISIFADEWRFPHPETSPWHFVFMPMKATDYNPARDCPNNNCSLAKIENFRAVLVNPSESSAKRLEALKFIVHLIGDIHQPLHCSDNDDNSGDNVKVKWLDGKTTTLHRVWDAEIISMYSLIASGLTGGDKEFAAELDSTITPDKSKEFQAGDPLSWMLETHSLAPKAYQYLPPPTLVTPSARGAKAANRKETIFVLNSRYYYSTYPIVDYQLIKGGIRLAQYLNNIFE